MNTQPQANNPEQGENEPVENQQTVLDNSATLNLKYLVADAPKKPFPWLSVLFCLFVLLLTFLGIWIAFAKEPVYHHHHQVKEGDSLRSLALYYYGTPRQWQRIFLANRDKLIQDEELKAGTYLVIPLNPQEQKYLQQKQAQQRRGSQQDTKTTLLPHKLSANDDIQKLAVFYYNDVAKWRKIYQANKSKIEQKKLRPGDKIYIPLTATEKRKLKKRLSQKRALHD